MHYLENACEQQNQEEASIILQRNLFKFMNVCTELVRNSKIIEIQEGVSKSTLINSLTKNPIKFFFERILLIVNFSFS